MLLALQKGIIYGPVNSRRLGRSLGINILLVNRKVCSFNCVYCHYGWTHVHRANVSRTFELPAVKAVKEALKEALAALDPPPAYMTFSGNGEPTVHPEFAHLVEEVITLRDRLAPEAKTAVISNSSLVSDERVRESLSKLDVRIMKLDCGSSSMFRKYNQPCNGVYLDDIVAGLTKLSDVTIQTLITSGKNGNLVSENIQKWIEELKRIKPTLVQLYTAERGYPAKGLKPAIKDELESIKYQVERAHIKVRIF